MTESIELKSRQDFQKLVDDHDAWLFDCDGVIWHDDELIQGVSQVLQYLRKLGKKCIYVTNNATKSREEFKQKFDKLHIEVDIDDIFGSAYASVAYLKYNLNFPPDKRVFVIGEAGLERELDLEGIKHTGGTEPEARQSFPAMDFSHYEGDSSIGAVMCGFDAHCGYTKYARAYRYLTENEGCLFILTNDDSTFPTGSGKLYPGSGAISAPLRYALPLKPPIVVGKPNSPFMDCIKQKHHLDPERTIMIGDRLDTDILFGLNGGVSTLAVLTGVNKLQDFDKPDSKIKPKYYMNSLGDLSILAHKDRQ